MKYVLIVDVPEPMESDDVRIDYLAYYHCADIIKNKMDQKLKPLPQKKTEEGERKKYPFNDDLWWDLYIKGWNECLDEILKEGDR